MRRPLIAVLSVLVAASLASGHSAAREVTKNSAKAPVQKLESVNACMKYRQQKLVEDGGLRMELRNCCHGPVKCAISWRSAAQSGGSKPESRSADLRNLGGHLRIGLRLRHGLRHRPLADIDREVELRDRQDGQRAYGGENWRLTGP